MAIQRTYEPTDLASKHSESKRARMLYSYQVTELVLVSIPSRTAAARSARVIGPPAAGTIRKYSVCVLSDYEGFSPILGNTR